MHSMNDINENIPTLTDIISIGDEDMLNHFNAQQFTRQADNIEDTTALSENSFDEALDTYKPLGIISAEQQPENLQPTETADDANAIPCITMGNEARPDISDEDFSEAMQRDYQNTEEASLRKVSEEELNEDIRLQIDAAVEAILPEIKLQLINSLYRHFK